jgi:TonB-dependent starch-binding outer membrane protein SusC
MNLKFKLTLLILVLINFSLFAQSDYSLKGLVTSKADNSVLPGVSIINKTTVKGTTTDFDGNYEIKVTKGDLIEFSFLGYTSQTITINNQKTLNIILAEDVNILDEVVVVGYGTQKKSHLTGSISKVVNEKLDQIGVSRVDDALVGQVSGVNIQATEGEAGSAPTIRIRGTGSITGESSPLIVVDGVVVDSDFLGSLDMNDVASFEILKDAASSAIYGSRGGNGVIMITTKNGKQGETKYSYSSLSGVKTARQSDAYNTSLKQTIRLELAANGDLSDKTKYKQLLGVDNSWQDIIFDGGIITNQSFSARGGNKKLSFSTALNFLHDEGVLLTDDYKKYSIKLKADYKVNDRLTIGASITPSYTDRRRFDGSTHDILRQPSWLPLYLDANTIRYVNRFREGGAYANAKIGDYAIQRMFDDYDLVNGYPSTGNGTDISNTSNTNPGAKVIERNYKEYKMKVFGSAYGSYKIADGLSFKTSFSGDYQKTRDSRYQGVQSSRNGGSAARLDSVIEKEYHFVTDNIVTFERSINKHDISSVFGISAERTTVEFESIQGTGYADDTKQIIGAATSITDKQKYEYVNTLLSFFGRVNYAFDDKYLGSISYRRDGSSVFGPNTKYGNFFAVSAGWNMHKEKFLEDSEIVNKLKLRVSYGVTGNNAFRTGNPLVDNYPYLAILDNTKTGVSGGNSTLVVNPLNIANPDLTWERQIEFNPGVDFILFNNFISGSIDYYTRTSDQLLLYNPISSTTGFTNALVNLGEVENKGIELELRTRNFSKDNFNWSSTFIASKNKNTLTNFADSNGQIQNTDSKRASEWINLEGNPISSFYGWVVDKEIPLEFISNPYHPVGGQARDVYVKDLNGDGLIDGDDRTILGSPYPDFVWSLTNDFSFGNLDVSFMFQGSHGAEVRNMGDQYIFNHFNSSQWFLPTTPNQGFIKEKIFTNSIVQDASYIALRNVNVGYNFKNDFLDKFKMSSFRVYLSAQNLMYLTAKGYTGFNPESISNTSSTTYGYQLAGSPVFSTISMGINVEF